MNLNYTNSAFILIIILLIQCYYSYEACPSLISNETVTVTCKHNNKTLNNCDNPMEGTEAYLICNMYYEEITLKENPKRLCQEGKWDGSIPQCYPICGRKRINKSSNTENDEEMLLDYPWHVAVYDSNKAFICAGSLIAMNMVLTTAYCVTLYDVGNTKIEPDETLFVASGKYYFTYDDNRDKWAQNSKVGTVHFHQEYQADRNNFAFDIAILVLTYSFWPSQVVQPISMNFDSSSQDLLLQDNGSVIGWGYIYKGKQQSQLLKALSVLYIPHNQCYSYITYNSQLYVTFDKICGISLENSNNGSLTLCNGVIGTGLFLKNKINGRYYITGILSSLSRLVTSVKSCNKFSFYTLIYAHETFMEYYTENIEMKNCALPSHPSNGEYVFLNTNITYEFGDLVPTDSKLALNCNVGYNFSSPAAKQYYCSRKGQWSPAFTGCTKIDADQHFKKSTALDYTYIILILVAVIIIIVVALVGVILYHFKFKQRWQLLRDIKLAGLDHFHNGNLKRFNPELDIGGQAEMLPYNNNFEFSRDKLILGKQLGSGAFGIVMQAEAFGIITTEEKTVVAVKTAKNIADHSHLKALISELKIMVHLGQHLNVVNLLGACTKNIAKRELLVIVEYCQFGNLYKYLLQNRENYIDQINNVTGCIDYSGGPEDFENVLAVPDYLCTQRETENTNPIYTKDLVSWSFQVARGMEYLSSRKILHGDLAARNILLADNNIVKICDFGLAKRLYKSMNYKKAKDGPLPIKWMAIESIRDQVFSTESDVWSFGIVLWEFFSLAQTPYPGMEADEKLYYKLLNGYKMESPPYAPREMYKIMCDCWSSNPASRPCFNELAGRVGLMLEENVRQHYIDLNDPYLVMNLKRKNENQTDYLGMLSPYGFQQRSIPCVNCINPKDILNDQPVGNPGYLCLISTDPAKSKTVNSLNNEEVAELSNEHLDVVA